MMQDFWDSIGAEAQMLIYVTALTAVMVVVVTLFRFIRSKWK